MDYTALSEPELIQELGDDARKWAAVFCQVIKKVQSPIEEIDEGWMTGWFANAIEVSYQKRTGR
jgi:hypothetical protein